MRIIPDFSPEIMKARRCRADVIQTLREQKCQPRLLYPTKHSITKDGETKISHDKNKFQKANKALQRIIMENTNTRRETTPQKKQKRDLLSTNTIEDNHTNIKVTLIIIRSNNHYSLTSLRINILNSPLKDID